MITIFEKQDESQVKIEDFSGDIIELQARLNELRESGKVYFAKQVTDCFELIFDL